MKHCPWCGGRSIYVEETSNFRYVVSICADCGAHGPETRVQTLGLDRETALKEAEIKCLEEWNKRFGEEEK